MLWYLLYGEMMKVYNSAIESMELPNIIQLERNLYCANFRLMKLLPANYIIRNAITKEYLNKSSIVIETSSGTFGLGLAMVCNLYGFKLFIVSDPVMDIFLKRRLEYLGAKVIIVKKANIIGGFQSSRLDQIVILRKQYPNNFWTNQYDNPDNPNSYVRVAEQIYNTIGNIDIIVGSVGSGGSMCGITSHLRKYNKNLYAVGVDTNGSVLFGQDDKPRILRGLGNSIIPKNLNHAIFNEIHWIEANQAYLETRNLYNKYSVFCGGTSGAAYSVGNWLKMTYPDKRILMVFPDEGYRYQNTIYNNNWLKKEGLNNIDFISGPKLIINPKQATRGWFRIMWNLKTLTDMVKVLENE